MESQEFTAIIVLRLVLDIWSHGPSVDIMDLIPRQPFRVAGYGFNPTPKITPKTRISDRTNLATNEDER